MNDEMRDLLYRAETLNCCWDALSTLLAPDKDELDRDKVSILVKFISEEQHKVVEELYNAQRTTAA